MEILTFALLLVAPFLVTGACDSGIQIQCHETHLKPLDDVTPGSAEFCSILKTAIPGLKTCFQNGMQGCSDEDRATLQSYLDNYLKGYSAYDAACQGGPQGNNTFPNPANCPEFMQCYEKVFKSLGIDPSDGIQQDEQMKLSAFGGMSNPTNPTSICPIFSKYEIRIGAVMECMQAASKKCSMSDPFGGISSLFGGGAMGSDMSTGQMSLAGLMAPVANALKLVKSDGSLNGTGWDLMFAYMCDEDCKGKLENMDKLFGNCEFAGAPPTQGPGVNEAALCKEYQEKTDCATESVGECPLLILMLHAYIKPMAKQAMPNCDLKISKPFPTIPSSLRDETSDNSAHTLVTSIYSFIILTLATLLL